MKKSVLLFWCLFAGIMIFAFGVQFAYSQYNNQFPSTPPSGAYHTSSQVVCDNCIASGNIADNAVTTAEILDGTISDPDVSGGAGIFVRKINGANGWHFLTGTLPNNINTYTPLSTIGNMGMINWVGSFVEILCDNAAGGVSGVITSSGGLALGGIYRYNHNIYKINAGQSLLVYSATDGTSNRQNLYMRPASGGSNFEFAREYVGTASSWTTNEPQITGFDCVIKLLSLCSGGTAGGATCS
jgi:hypothetical protein